jgi:hypothetical protein
VAALTPSNGIMGRQGAWSGPEELPGTIIGGPGAVAWANGRIDVAGVTPAGEGEHWYWE